MICEGIMKTMKRKILPLLMVFFSCQTSADAQIIVTGKVVPLPCTVNTTQLNMKIGNVYASLLAKPGSSTTWLNETIKLTNCPSVTSGITATFSGLKDATYYKNTGTAKNVEIQLQSASGVDLNNGVTQQIAVSSQRTADLPIRLRIYSKNGNATDGTIQGLINVTYTYQ